VTVPRDVVSDALALIKPRPEQEAACGDIIERRLRVLRKAHRSQAAIPSPGKLKKQLGDVGDAMKQTQRALRQLSDSSLALVFRTRGDTLLFLKRLDRAIHTTQLNHDTLAVPRGRRYHWDNVKALTARLAAELLRAFSAKHLTKTTPTKETGPGEFYRLASLLYEGITGEADVDLSQYCRDVLDKANEPAGGRIEPNVMVKIPLAKR
jgi:hypothetical protein